MDKGILLVTGASRGIGAATCRLAAAQGWDIAINYAANEAALLHKDTKTLALTDALVNVPAVSSPP